MTHISRHRGVAGPASKPRHILASMATLALALGAQAQAPQAGGAAPGQPATTSHAAAKAQPRQHRQAPLRDISARRLIGTDVYNAQNAKVAQVRDLIVDVNSGRVQYVALAFQPGILSRERVVPVPLDQLRWGGAERERLVYDVDREQLERHAIEKSDWNERFTSDAQRMRRVHEGWGRQVPANAQARRATDLLGMDVLGSDGKKLGDIRDLVVDTREQRVHYVLLDVDRGWFGSDKRLTVPLNQFRAAADGKQLALGVDKARVESTAGLDRNDEDLNDPAYVSRVQRSLGTWGTGVQGAPNATVDASRDAARTRRSGVPASGTPPAQR